MRSFGGSPVRRARGGDGAGDGGGDGSQGAPIAHEKGAPPKKGRGPSGRLVHHLHHGDFACALRSPPCPSDARRRDDGPRRSSRRTRSRSFRSGRFKDASPPDLRDERSARRAPRRLVRVQTSAHRARAPRARLLARRWTGRHHGDLHSPRNGPNRSLVFAPQGLSLIHISEPTRPY